MKTAISKRRAKQIVKEPLVREKQRRAHKAKKQKAAPVKHRAHFPAYEHYEADKERMLNEFFNRMAAVDQTNAVLASKSGVSESTLRNWQVGKTRFPRYDTLWRVARALGFRRMRFE